MGAGAGVACAEWVAVGRSVPELEQWAFGFAGAIAAAAQMRQDGDPLANMDAAAIHAWLGDHCRRPEEALSTALVRMVFARSGGAPPGGLCRLCPVGRARAGRLRSGRRRWTRAIRVEKQFHEEN
ncbi:hypothetical protein GCM10009416_06950 [Craurococcus roseus]|uniref:Uncharacterized protein n=1 Tax=Craurococcus roseus TaxID=77585 RepID=A0ABN1EP74_9PROT